MCIELKIKSKHLALEPAIIRKEEEKLKRRIKYHRSGYGDQISAITLGWKLCSLTNHRKIDVRNESRATHLARTYLAGKPYAQAELKRNDDYYFVRVIVPRVVAMVTRYGSGEQRKATKDTIINWANTAI